MKASKLFLILFSVPFMGLANTERTVLSCSPKDQSAKVRVFKVETGDESYLWLSLENSVTGASVKYYAGSTDTWKGIANVGETKLFRIFGSIPGYTGVEVYQNIVLLVHAADTITGANNFYLAENGNVYVLSCTGPGI